MEVAVDCRPGKLPRKFAWNAKVVVAIAADGRGMPWLSVEIAVD